MSATTIEAPALARSSSYAQPPASDIDASARMLLLLFASAVKWLALSFLLSLVASIKLHGPNFLGHSAPLTYGRLVAAASATFLYGFASQAAVAVALWLLCRLGKTFLIFPGGVLIGWIVWNFTVLFGFLGILLGGTTSMPFFEMPFFTWPMVFVAFCLFGISALLTFNSRTEREVYPSVWFILTAFFVFPWIYSTAGLMLGKYALRAPMQPVVAAWFANNFHALWLAPIAIAVIFYFVPKLSQFPLFSNSMAAFAFWVYLLAAQAGGFQNISAVPSWLPSISAVANIVLLLPVAAIGLNWYNTWSGHGKKNKKADPVSKYIVFAALSFMSYAALNAIVGVREVDHFLGLTLFPAGVTQLSLYGFIAIALLGAAHHIIPKLSSVEWPCSTSMGWHFGLSVAGVLLSVLGLLSAGYVQAEGLSDARVPFLEVMHRTMAPTGLSTIGVLCLFVAQLLMLVNIAGILKNCCCMCKASKREAAR